MGPTEADRTPATSYVAAMSHDGIMSARNSVIDAQTPRAVTSL